MTGLPLKNYLIAIRITHHRPFFVRTASYHLNPTGFQLPTQNKLRTRLSALGPNDVMRRCPFHAIASPSRKNDVAQDLPFAVGLALPDREKATAMDRELALFERPNFGVSRFVGKLSVDNESLRVDFRRARETRALESRAVHILDFGSALSAG